jgi:cytochrome c-type biogenesis protein CcmH/NrfG
MCYLAMEHSLNQVISLLTQIILVDPNNIEALVLRAKTYELTKDVLRAKLDRA